MATEHGDRTCLKFHLKVKPKLILVSSSLKEGKDGDIRRNMKQFVVYFEEEFQEQKGV